ncbi:MipA/OmpV family protein [Shewanella intestini]|uniref:MipA/OmpV family protein n=1 Tax=Shewanella intestini TaxID=2017544 RepID=A0ABS5HZF8_9GAMM|nr:MULTISPECIES: MipA/OmpV family protein [Shewanella]MBR9727172.1 MipA/OmpV family protein [Shewanella intestini]MRG35974.1 MipA/OmpV family protein [Shewanella sp. XMDDZSB0408]
MKYLTLVISSLLLSQSALAADNTYIRNGNVYSHEGKFFAGAGVVTGSEFYKGQDHKTAAYLNGGFHGSDFNADVSGVNYRFLGDNESLLNMSVFVTANAEFDAKDADILDGMKDRKASGDLGLNLDLHLGNGTLSSKFQHDVTDVYNGYQADMTYYYPIKVGFADIVPYAGVHYYSKDFANYYTGVSKKDATNVRSEYQASSTLAYRAGYVLVAPVTEHLDIVQSAGYTRLGSDMADSPLIGSQNQWATSVGVNYHF